MKPARPRRRRSRHQRELLDSLDIFRVVGAVGIAGGALIGVADGSATLAWTIGTIGAASLGYSLLIPLVARRQRVSWDLAAIAVCTAFAGGAAYLLAPSDATWWLGQLGFLPAAALALYFGAGARGNDQRDSMSEGPWDAPAGGDSSPGGAA